MANTPQTTIEGLRAHDEPGSIGTLSAALGVLVLDPKIRAWLQANDPQAFAQAERALLWDGAREVKALVKQAREEG